MNYLNNARTMEIRFIGQGYNLEKNTSVANEIIQALNSQDFNSFKGLIAFASYGGTSALTEHIMTAKGHLRNFKIVVGIDNFVTSKEALEEILSWDVESYIYHSNSVNIFHPKIYLFEGKDKVSLIIGSNNLTEFGLVKNIEASVLITYQKSEVIENSITDEIESYFENLFNNTDPNLFKITNELITRLELENSLPSDENRRKDFDEKIIKEDTQSTNETTDKNKAKLFSSTILQKNPSGFNPKRKSRTTTRKIKSTPKKETEEPATSEVAIPASVTLIDDNRVLIAEIGRGDRWKQVNFPIEMFESFFGARAGDNSYFIEIQHVLSNGSLEPVENRQAVTVTSGNYRFEIGAAKGAYPNNNRPISIFIRIGSNKFRYHLLMPKSANYLPISNYLNQKYSGPSRHLRRITTSKAELKAISPDFPFWKTKLFTND